MATKLFGMSSTKRSKLFTLANSLTIVRIFLVPWLFLLILNKQASMAFLVYVLALATDFFDGFLARRQRSQNIYGYYLDAVADNLLIGFTFLALTLAGNFHYLGFVGYFIIFIFTTSGFFLSPATEAFYRAFKKARLRQIGGALIIVLIISAMFDFYLTHLLTALIFAILLTCALIFFYNIILERKKSLNEEKF